MDEHDLFLGVWGCDVTVTFSLLTRRGGPLSEATTARIKALSLEQLESFWEAMIDFQCADDLGAWLATPQRRD